MTSSRNPSEGPDKPPSAARARSASGQKALDARERLLRELTGVPTAAFREHGVIDYVRKWAKRRSDVVLRKDKAGNLTLSLEGAASRQPVYFTAHMDHPAFVIEEPQKEVEVVEAAFRGGVKPDYFEGSRVRLRPGRADEVQGEVASHQPANEARPDARARVRFAEPVTVKTGDILTWALPGPAVRDRRLYAPACDDLAGVAAALGAFDALRTRDPAPDIRVLLTRAEEVGFIGAMAAARSRTLPKSARLICLECSKSFDDSPIHAGPIVRVGDRSATFDPDLTYRLSRIAERLAAESDSFRFQRKLMPGGTCEASAFTAFGYAAACLCLPLGNYHNMGDVGGAVPPGIEPEVIGVDDFHALVRLLVASADGLLGAERTPGLRRRLETLYRSRAADL
ncbi:MAG: M20/M25/M40 family metallo-hydrolase [Planctomycetota bacterium]